jgi:transcription initiation factor TFIIIB Brf1 subunit/transcription initiation factor TFIIB
VLPEATEVSAGRSLLGGENDRCAACGSPLASANGERYCSSCGIVAEDQPIESEYANPSAVPLSLAATHEAAPIRTTKTSKISPRDYAGRRVESYRSFLRLFEEEKRQLRTNRAFAYIPVIYRITGLMGLPRYIAVRAVVLEREMFRRRLARGYPVDASAAVAIMLAAREQGIVFSFHDLGDRADENWRRIASLYRKVRRELLVDAKIPTAEDYIRKAAFELEVSGVLRDEAIALAKELTENAPTGAGPVSVAAAMAWRVWSRPLALTKSRLAKVFGITEVSVRSALHVYFPDEIGEAPSVRARRRASRG